jgi:GNAT superfamily N-acetyltransferase
MQHYSTERKESALKKMRPPNNISITKLSLDMGISQATLYYWRKQARHIVFKPLGYIVHAKLEYLLLAVNEGMKTCGNIMKTEYELTLKENLTDEVRKIFAGMLKQQGKVRGNLLEKADRCKFLCIANINGETAAIGAVKIKTASDFSNEKSALPDLRRKFEWELGYLYTNPKYTGKGIAKNIARKLVDKFGKGNLMASTEVTANPAMVRILEQLGFSLYGKHWKSAIHGNDLGLFLRFE